VGEVLPAAHIERVLRDYYAGRLGDVDLEDRLLRDVDENHFRAICQTALAREWWHRLHNAFGAASSAFVEAFKSRAVMPTAMLTE